MPERDPRMELIAMIYRLHGAMRSLFDGPPSAVRLVLLEALVLGVIVNDVEPPTVSQIGRELGYSRQSVQRAVNKLLELGFVARRDNPQHKRSPMIVPLKPGIECMAQVQESSNKLAIFLAEQFPDDRTAGLVGELQELASAINAYGEARGRI